MLWSYFGETSKKDWVISKNGLRIFVRRLVKAGSSKIISINQKCTSVSLQISLAVLLSDCSHLQTERGHSHILYFFWVGGRFRIWAKFVLGCFRENGNFCQKLGQFWEIPATVQALEFQKMTLLCQNGLKNELKMIFF